MSLSPSQLLPTGARRTPAPLWAVQSLVFLSSLGTGVVTNGIFFVAKAGGGFTPVMNFGLGLVLGVTYVAGAAGVGPVLRRVAARRPEISSRLVVVGLSLLMGLAALLPPLAARFAPALTGPAVWAAVAIYAPASGAFWPILESYLGGGRSGALLRRVIGQFNIIWALAVLVSLWAMAPLLAEAPLAALLAFGCLQIMGTLLVIPLGAEPGRHVVEEIEPHPPVYAQLLTTFRLLLPTSYYIVSVWSPYAPEALDSLGIALAWQTPIAATWMLSRFVTFAAMERWHGWHGRWGSVVVGVVGLVGGIGLALAAPLLGPGPGVATLLFGLGLLGVGMGVIYTASLYYAMEVGRGEIEAGGTHEALIGIGFSAGPATGLAAVGIVRTGVAPGVPLNVAMLAILGVVLLVVGVSTAGRVRRSRSLNRLPASDR